MELSIDKTAREIVELLGLYVSDDTGNCYEVAATYSGVKVIVYKHMLVHVADTVRAMSPENRAEAGRRLMDGKYQPIESNDPDSDDLIS